MLTKILFRLFNPLQKIGYFSVEICLAWVFSEMLAVPHAHQLKHFITPPKRKNGILSIQDVEGLSFFLTLKNISGFKKSVKSF